MRLRRAVLQTPAKPSVPLRLPFHKNGSLPTSSQSTLPQLLISLHFNSFRTNVYKKPGGGPISAKIRIDFIWRRDLGFPHVRSGRLADFAGSISRRMAAVGQKLWRSHALARVPVVGGVTAHAATACGLRLVAAGDGGTSQVSRHCQRFGRHVVESLAGCRGLAARIVPATLEGQRGR